MPPERTPFGPDPSDDDTPAIRPVPMRGGEGDSDADEGPLPGPYRIETPCGERVLGFLTPLHADRYLGKHGMTAIARDMVQIAGLWCLPDPHAGTPEQLAAEALHPLFQELHAVYARVSELERLLRARRDQVTTPPQAAEGPRYAGAADVVRAIQAHTTGGTP